LTIKRFFSALGLLLFASTALATVSVTGVRVSTTPQKTRVVFELSGPFSFQSFTLAHPDRVVLDVKGAQIARNFALPSLRSTPIEAIRYGIQKSGAVRLVLDLEREQVAQPFQLKPLSKKSGAQAPWRLVVDLRKPFSVKNTLAPPGKA